jgi:hypothetical protein
MTTGGLLSGANIAENGSGRMLIFEQVKADG